MKVIVKRIIKYFFMAIPYNGGSAAGAGAGLPVDEYVTGAETAAATTTGGGVGVGVTTGGVTLIGVGGFTAAPATFSCVLP
jgi:hypothetical protein